MLQSRMTTAFERSKVLEVEAAQAEALSFMTFIERRDFIGAITLLRFQKDSHTLPAGVNADLWIAYCYFHLGRHEDALRIYTTLASHEPPPLDSQTLDLYRAICMLYMGRMKDARELATSLPPTPLSNRLLFHACSRLLDEESLVTYHSKLRNVSPDQMALAAVHYLRTHYQQALECYEEVLSAQPECYAIYIQMALCYYKIGDYARCEEFLASYRDNAEDSLTSLNLLSAAKYRQGKLDEALDALAQMKDDAEIANLPIFKHNRCLYADLHAAALVLPTLVGIVPEARLNIIRLYTERGDYEAAYKYVENFEPAVSTEYTLKAAAFAYYGQSTQDMGILQYAQAAYSTVGQSDADKDTVLGRRSMAAAFFLEGEFDETCMYMDSIADIPKDSEDCFTLNYALALAATGKIDVAMNKLASVAGSKLFTPVHRTWLARLYIRNHMIKEAFELYVQADTAHPQTLALLKVLANESFAAGEYAYTEKAAQLLMKQDPEHAEAYVPMLSATRAAVELQRRGRKLEPPQMVFDSEQ